MPGSLARLAAPRFRFFAFSANFVRPSQKRQDLAVP